MPAPVEIITEPALTLQLLAWVLTGSLLGSCSGAHSGPARQ